MAVLLPSEETCVYYQTGGTCAAAANDTKRNTSQHPKGRRHRPWPPVPPIKQAGSLRRCRQRHQAKHQSTPQHQKQQRYQLWNPNLRPPHSVPSAPAPIKQPPTEPARKSTEPREPVPTIKQQDTTPPTPTQPKAATLVPPKQHIETTPTPAPKPIPPAVPSDMILIPEGEFQMGSNDNTDEKADTYRLHRRILYRQV